MNAWPKLRRPLALLALPLCLALSAPSAMAQKLVVGLEKHGKHGSIGVQFGYPRNHAPIRVHQPRYEPPRAWFPGHYEQVSRRVWVPGCVRQEYVPPVYEERHWRDYSGRVHVERVQVCPATWRTVQDPGEWRVIQERMWVEGSWQKRHC